jgi:hypothetical protein
MASSRQSDLFQQDEQSDLFGEDTPTPEYRADPDSVRAELYQDSGRSPRGSEASLGAEDGPALPDHLSADDELAA